ncbi:Peptidase M28 [Neofusicoccum parvum]|uniref:Peptide hydrolase n=2 Tax=Neofusicoccum parvum TaxID=310453 RepID=R1EKL4_BOTPV|nr:putative glycoside hydrolase family 47 protein [Neofusicoccum parvum UCRNP2]GME39398.1 Peptidase M28 [Neofusicoccum parvum]GME43029.1 Peptidase M28 [Neofusicoccum parvum]
MRFLESSAALAALAVVGEASTPAGHVHAVRPASLLERRGPQLFRRDWQPDVENWGPAPETPNDIAVAASTNETKPPVASDALQNDIDSAALLDHAENLQAIAYQTTGRNRVFGSPGHNFTALYLYELISELSDYYDVEYQPFVETFSGGDATLTVNGEDQDAALMTYAPNGQVEAPIVAVSNLGCDPADYPAEVAGNIALISRGSCEFGLKAAYAGAAGAAGAVIYNNINGSLSGTLGAPNRTEGAYPPTAAISLANGQAILALIEAGETVGNLNVNSIIEDRVTMNVIAQTKAGDPNNVIFVGAHADSVEAGPGINDNGSGSIGILEVALQLAKYEVNNAVRFAWWSAEEFGLLGAEYYVNQSTPEDLDKIRLYLNFDMIASPNYFLGIYDGDGSAFNLSGPTGSAEAEALFEGYFESKGLPSQPTEFSGRSDYGPFLDVGVAAGGLFTGAEVIKTEEEAALYGGTAGLAYDENYHKVGDTVDNLNLEAFLINTRAIAHSVATYAESFDTLPPRSRRVVRRNPLIPKAKATGCHHKHEEVKAR